jgi:pyruvate formate lyase activating enzyme
MQQERTRTNDERVVCRICPHACSLAEGQRGVCRARVAQGGEVTCEAYGRITSLALDPVEKKPLARFHPGSMVLSLGGYGCNLRCPFCQNASIAWAGPEDVPYRTMTPKQVVRMARGYRSHGCIGIAYTYNEPAIAFEFVRDTARLAREEGLVNVVVSNGMICPEPLAEVLPYLDAANIDLKAFTPEAYRKLGGDLEAVKATIATLASAPNCHLEVTTLVVPGLNNTPEQIEAIAAWLADLDPHIPYHLSRFFPAFHMQEVPPTDVRLLKRLAKVAGKNLDDVLLGNVR